MKDVNTVTNYGKILDSFHVKSKSFIHLLFHSAQSYLDQTHRLLGTGCLTT